MKKFLPVILLLIICCGPAYAGVLVLEGKYQKKNLFVQNEFASSGVGFCVFQVKVNGEVTTDEWNSSAFEISLDQRNIKPGSKILVEIHHKDGCSPKVLNPEALKPNATFETVDIKCSSEGLISFTTEKESGSLPFYIEQFKWNKWVIVGEVQGQGDGDKNIYQFKAPMISGDNRFRVKQLGLDKKPRYSRECSSISKVPPVTYKVVKKQVQLSGDTNYEVYNQYGELVKKGYGKSIDMNNMPASVYYLNYDRTMAEISIK